MTITLSPDDRLEEDQDDVEERLDEASSCSSEEDEVDDEYEELHRGVDLCGIGLEPTKSQPNVPKEELMVLLYLDLIEEERGNTKLRINLDLHRFHYECTRGGVR